MKFLYTALNEGKQVKGSLDTDNEQKVVEFLREKKMTVLKIEEMKPSLMDSYQTTFGKVSFNDVVDFTRKIAMMLNAGLTIIEALEILKKQTAKPALLALILQIDADVRAGISCARHCCNVWCYVCDDYVCYTSTTQFI